MDVKRPTRARKKDLETKYRSSYVLTGAQSRGLDLVNATFARGDVVIIEENCQVCRRAFGVSKGSSSSKGR